MRIGMKSCELLHTSGAAALLVMQFQYRMQRQFLACRGGGRSAAGIAAGITAGIAAGITPAVIAAAAEQEEQDDQYNNPAAVVTLKASTVHKSSTP